MGIIICIQRVLPRKSNWFDSNMFHLRETNHISQGSRQTEAIGCVCVCGEIEREGDFKEFTHSIAGTDKSKICRTSQQSGDAGKS